MNSELAGKLEYLGLTAIRDQYDAITAAAAEKQLALAAYFAELIGAEVAARKARSARRRVRNAHFPCVKSIDDYDWTFPTRVNREQIMNLFTLGFLEQEKPGNVVFIGSAGVGKTMLGIALGYEACRRCHDVRFTTAMDMVNHLRKAQMDGTLLHAMKAYTAPELLVVDELGYLPVEHDGASLLFQVFSDRYERASTVVTSNLPYAEWIQLFGNDAAMTSALLDRMLHHCTTVRIEGPSYRTENPGRPAG